MQCALLAFISATVFLRTTLNTDSIADGSLYLSMIFFSLVLHHVQQLRRDVAHGKDTPWLSSVENLSAISIDLLTYTVHGLILGMTPVQITLDIGCFWAQVILDLVAGS